MALTTRAAVKAAPRLRLAAGGVVLILTAFVPVQQAWGASLTAGGAGQAAAAAGGPDAAAAVAPFGARWEAASPEQVAASHARTKEPARVRIGLRLTPFHKVVTRHPDGTTTERHVPSEPLRHTLRARLGTADHFFVGDWHVETEPTKWVRKSGRYEVKLNFYRRYGAFGQLEENVGAVVLAGVLEEQRDNVHVLVGVARRRLRDKFGHPYFDVVAGFAPGSVAAVPASPAADARPPARF